MAIGYFTLCFGGEAAKPYALVDGQRYEVQVAKQGDVRQQYLIEGDRRLAIRVTLFPFAAHHCSRCAAHASNR